MKQCRWEVVHTGPAQWHVRFVAASTTYFPDGTIVVTSESYKRRRAALRAIEVIGIAIRSQVVETRDVDTR